MTRYMIIFAVVLIGSVYCPKPCVPKGFQEECSRFDENTCRPAVLLQMNPPICETATDCAPVLCDDDCHCGDCSNQRCYFGCQAGNRQSLITLPLDPEDEFLQNGYCRQIKDGWLGTKDPLECTGGVCGACAETWCARIDVTKGDHSPTGGACQRGSESWAPGRRGCNNEGSKVVKSLLLGGETETCSRVCTRNIRENCTAWNSDPYYLLHDGDDDCVNDCGYPLPHCGTEDWVTWQPVNSKTAFADLCGRDSAMQLTKGRCTAGSDRRCKPSSYYADGLYGSRPATHLLEFEVVKLPPAMCDCGMEEARLSWGDRFHCGAHSGSCFAVVDQSGMDVGTCQLSEIPAQVFHCNGDELKCDDPEHYDGNDDNYPEEKPPTPAPAYKKESTYDTPDPTYYDTKASDSGSASTCTVLSVAGIALAHAML